MQTQSPLLNKQDHQTVEVAQEEDKVAFTCAADVCFKPGSVTAKLGTAISSTLLLATGLALVLNEKDSTDMGLGAASVALATASLAGLFNTCETKFKGSLALTRLLAGGMSMVSGVYLANEIQSWNLDPTFATALAGTGFATALSGFG